MVDPMEIKQLFNQLKQLAKQVELHGQPSDGVKNIAIKVLNGNPSPGEPTKNSALIRWFNLLPIGASRDDVKLVASVLAKAAMKVEADRLVEIINVFCGRQADYSKELVSLNQTERKRQACDLWNSSTDVTWLDIAEYLGKGPGEVEAVKKDIARFAEKNSITIRTGKRGRKKRDK